MPPLNIAQGTAPNSPTNGDMWTTSAGLYVRINGGTVGPLSAGGGSPVAVADEGTNLTAGTSSINFSGAGVTATAAGNVVTVTIPGGAGTAATTVTTQYASATAGTVGASTSYAREDHVHALSGFVDDSSNETIGGNKTFSGNTTFSASTAFDATVNIQPTASNVTALVLQRPATNSSSSFFLAFTDESNNILTYVSRFGKWTAATTQATLAPMAFPPGASVTSPGLGDFWHTNVVGLQYRDSASIDRTIADLQTAQTFSGAKTFSGSVTNTSSIGYFTSGGGAALALPSTSSGVTITGDNTGAGRIWSIASGVGSLAISFSNTGTTLWNTLTTLSGWQNNNGFGGAITASATPDGNMYASNTFTAGSGVFQNGASANGTLYASAVTLTDKLTLDPSDSLHAPVRFPAGTLPSLLTAGDMYAASTGLYYTDLTIANSTASVSPLRIPTKIFQRASANTTSTSSTTFTSITGIGGVTVQSGRTYTFEAHFWFSAGATTTTLKPRISYPTLTAGNAMWHHFSNAGVYNQTATASALGAGSTVFIGQVAAVTTLLSGKLTGTIIPSASGTFSLDFGTTAGAGAANVLAGSYFVVEEVG